MNLRKPNNNTNSVGAKYVDFMIFCCKFVTLIEYSTVGDKRLTNVVNPKTEHFSIIEVALFFLTTGWMLGEAAPMLTQTVTLILYEYSINTKHL